MSKDAARDNSPARRAIHEATEGDTNQQSTDSLRGEYLEVKEKGRVEKPQAEKPAAPEKERDGSLSINGVPRNLDLSESESDELAVAFKETRGGQKGGTHKKHDKSHEKPHEKPPEPVLTEEEKQVQAAAKLITAYENRLDKEVMEPTARKFFDALDQIERDMPKEELAKLEAARLRFQENKELEEEMQTQVEEKGLLLYVEPTRKPQIMKEFDGRARQLFKEVTAGTLTQIENMQKEFPGLSEAYERLRKLDQEESEEEREPLLEA